jgi:magnesium transporter
MARFLKSRLKAKGAAPGSLIFMGKKKMDTPYIRLIQFDSNKLVEKEYLKIDEVFVDIKTDKINWLNIDGLHDIEPIIAIGKYFKISPLALENVLNTGQRSKYFEDKTTLTLVTKAVEYNTENNKILSEHISFILCQNTLISFQEKIGTHFEPVRERIRKNIGYVRNLPADYLLYTLIDCIVDNNLIIIEQIGDKIEQIEPKLIHPNRTLSNEIFFYKTEISYFRKTVRPLKEVVTRVLRTNSELIHKETLVYFQELNDLIDHSIEAIETYYSIIADQLSIYNTNISHKANDVMKVLTIFASIFIPLTFIVGVYGTNFDYLPELHFKYGYFGMWGGMIIITLLMLYYFKRNKWF